MEGSAAERLQYLVDDLEIRRVMHEYAARVDLRDWSALRSVLADDVVVDYHNGRTRVVGADEVVAYIRENTAHLAWQHHNVTAYGVEVDGDVATGRSYLISHQVIRAEPTHVVMMAAGYECRFVRRGTWQLAHMVHTIKLTNFLPITATAPPGVEIPPAVAP